VIFFAALHESAFGPKQTWACALHMSAFDPKRTSLVAPHRHGLLRNFAFAVAIGCKADMTFCTAYVSAMRR